MPTHPWKADKWFSSPWNYLPEVAGNLVGAFGYNTFGIPIAAGLLYPFFGVLLSPMLAGGDDVLFGDGGIERQPAPPVVTIASSEDADVNESAVATELQGVIS